MSFATDTKTDAARTPFGWRFYIVAAAVFFTFYACTTSLPPQVTPHTVPAASVVITPAYTYQGRTGSLLNDTGHADYVLWIAEYGKLLDAAPVPSGDWVAAPDGIAGHWWASDAATVQLGQLYNLHLQALKP